MSIINTYEAVSSMAVQQAYVDLIGKVLDEKQNSYTNGNITNEWYTNAIIDVSLILKADSFRTLGIDQLDSTIYWANAWLKHKGAGFYDSGNLEYFNVMPSNVGGNVFVTSSYNVLIPEKSFENANTILNSNSINSSTNFLSGFANQILNNSNVYANLNINTGLDFAISNNYLDYSEFSSNSFSSENSLYLIDSAVELGFAKSKTDVAIHILNGRGF